MILTAIQAAQGNLTGLGLYERFAPLAYTAVRHKEVAQTTDGQSVYEIQKYPISCQVSEADCWNAGRYQHLVPDSNKKSIAYFEEVRGMNLYSPRNRDLGREWLYFDGEVRFVAWLNLQRLGIQDCSKSSEFALLTIKALHELTFQITDPTWVGARARFEFLGQEAKSLDIFSRYTYARKEALNFYPNDYFALRFAVELAINRNCIGSFAPGFNIECITV